MRYTIFGATYGCGAYGTGNYQNSTCSSTSAGSSGSSGGQSGGGLLTDTGFDVVLIATIAAALIFIALIVRFWRRPKKSPSPESQN